MKKLFLSVLTFAVASAVFVHGIDEDGSHSRRRGRSEDVAASLPEAKRQRPLNRQRPPYPNDEDCRGYVQQIRKESHDDWISHQLKPWVREAHLRVAVDQIFSVANAELQSLLALDPKSANSEEWLAKIQMCCNQVSEALDELGASYLDSKADRIILARVYFEHLENLTSGNETSVYTFFRTFFRIALMLPEVPAFVEKLDQARRDPLCIEANNKFVEGLRGVNSFIMDKLQIFLALPAMVNAFMDNALFAQLSDWIKLFGMNIDISASVLSDMFLSNGDITGKEDSIKAQLLRISACLHQASVRMTNLSKQMKYEEMISPLIKSTAKGNEYCAEKCRLFSQDEEAFQYLISLMQVFVGHTQIKIVCEAHKKEEAARQERLARMSGW
jgi:hypothetical protein